MRTIIKRASGLILCTAIVIVTAGCSDKNAATSALPSSAPSVDDVIAEGMARADPYEREELQARKQKIIFRRNGIMAGMENKMPRTMES